MPRARLAEAALEDLALERSLVALAHSHGPFMWRGVDYRLRASTFRRAGPHLVILRHLEEVGRRLAAADRCEAVGRLAGARVAVARVHRHLQLGRDRKSVV